MHHTFLIKLIIWLVHLKLVWNAYTKYWYEFNPQRTWCTTTYFSTGSRRKGWIWIRYRTVIVLKSDHKYSTWIWYSAWWRVNDITYILLGYKQFSSRFQGFNIVFRPIYIWGIPISCRVSSRFQSFNISFRPIYTRHTYISMGFKQVSSRFHGFNIVFRPIYIRHIYALLSFKLVSSWFHGFNIGFRAYIYQAYLYLTRFQSGFKFLSRF